MSLLCANTTKPSCPSIRTPCAPILCLAPSIKISSKNKFHTILVRQTFQIVHEETCKKIDTKIVQKQKLQNLEKNKWHENQHLPCSFSPSEI